MPAEGLEFWFELGVAAEGGVPVVFGAVSARPVLAAQGWKDSPFNLCTVKGDYIWRDVERLCGRYCLPSRRPSRFPRNGLLATRIACLARSEPRLPAFVRAVFRANFAEDRDISDGAIIGAILESMGQPGGDLMERAQEPVNKERLRDQPRRARRRNIVGAPSFVAGGELFRGDERLSTPSPGTERGGSKAPARAVKVSRAEAGTQDRAVRNTGPDRSSPGAVRRKLRLLRPLALT